jgi:hypothetical protein
VLQTTKCGYGLLEREFSMRADASEIDPSFREDSRKWLCIAAFALVIAPIVLSGIGALGRTWYPSGDWAMIELRTHDVGTDHSPLLGPYSRFHWNHLGPMMFVLFAIPYRLSGGAPASLLFATACVNAIAAATALGLALRCGGKSLFFVLAIFLGLLVHSLGPSTLRDPWNPWVTILPLATLIIASWAALTGDRFGLYAVVVAGAFVAQSHIAFVPVTVILTLGAVVCFWRQAAPARLKASLSAAVLGLVCWAPPLLDLAIGDRNLLAIVRQFSASEAPAAGLGRALETTGIELGVQLPWAKGTEAFVLAPEVRVVPAVVALLPAVCVFLLTSHAVWRARAFKALHLQAVVGVATVVSTFAVSRISGDVHDYLVRWWWAVATLFFASAAWSFWEALTRSHSARLRSVLSNQRARTFLFAFCAVLLVWPAAQSIFDIQRASVPIHDRVPIVAALLDKASAIPKDKSVLLRCTGPECGWEFDAVAVRLVALGVDVYAEDRGINRFKLGKFRVVAPGDPQNRNRRGVWVASGSRVDDFRSAKFGSMLALYNSFSSDEWIELMALQKQLRDGYQSAGRNDLIVQLEEGGGLRGKQPQGVTQQVLARYETLRRKGHRAGLFVTEQADNEPPPPATW